MTDILRQKKNVRFMDLRTNVLLLTQNKFVSSMLYILMTINKNTPNNVLNKKQEVVTLLLN